MRFGKYKGQTFEYILKKSPCYLYWLKKNVKLSQDVENFIDKNWKEIKQAHIKDKEEWASQYDEYYCEQN